MNLIQILWKDERGASLAESVVLMAMLTAGVIAGMNVMNSSILALMNHLGTVFTTAVP